MQEETGNSLEEVRNEEVIWTQILEMGNNWAEREIGLGQCVSVRLRVGTSRN